MPSDKQVTFGRFRLDPTNECLWQGAQAIALRPKAYAVLKHLVDRPGQLVTKQQLLEAVWPGTFVGDAVLKVTIRQLREALADDADRPQYIETAHRRGYRFIGQIGSETVVTPLKTPPPDATVARPDAVDGTPVPSSPSAAGVLGREAELAKLRRWLERALAGERQIVFVTGEAGIGKTTLVNTLLAQVAVVPGILMARGQCLEQYGAGEAYLPVLDAFSRLGRGPGGERIVALLGQHAPAWLLALPSLIPAADRDQPGRDAPGATRERMLREMAEAIEVMTADAPLIVVLEDLHWSDYSTLDLIAYLARRRDRARLMVIGTYRPVDVILGDHPLKGVKRELQAHGLCHELPLEYLTEESVAEYLAVKCPGQMPRLLARLIHRRTEGNPLFMVNLVDYLVDEHVVMPVGGEWRLRGGLAEIESGVPENVKQLIEKQIERLSPEERTVLEGASVVGMECSSVAIGAGLDRPTDWVEDRCEALVQRHQFLSAARLVELPDGTVTPRYKFTHVLYLDVPYRRLPAMRRAQIHVRIGHSGEAVYGDRVSEIATELAMHFEQGRDHPRAVKYLLMAAENAVRRSAHHEAEALARRGLQALEMLPLAEERDRQELSLRRILGISLMAVKGFAAADVKAVFERALVLCARLGASSEAFMVEWLLGLFHYFRAELVPSRAIVERLLKRAETVDEGLIVIEARRASGVTLLELGRFTDSLNDFDAVTDLYDADRQRSQISFAGQDPKVVAECFAARALWTLGYPSQALARLELGLLLAQQLSHVESLVVATHCAAHLHQLRGEPALVQERAETVIGLAEEYGLAVWIAFGRMNRGWARIEQGDLEGGLEELQRGLAEYDDSGAKLWRPHYVGLLAQTLARADRVSEALTNVAAALALVEHTGESWCAAELHRVRGELLIAQASGETGPGQRKSTPTKLSASVATQVERCFREALAIARQQHARSWELRAVTSLARFYRRQDKRRDGGPMLQETYDWFTEGHETADLVAARAVLQYFHVST